jgi:hypothetical protein
VASFQVQRLERELLLREERAQTRNHLRGAVAVAKRPSCGLPRAVDVRRVEVEHPQARAGIGDDAGERLIDLVGDRGRQRAEGRDPRYVRELGAGLVQRFLGHLAGGHVLDRADEHWPIRDPMSEAAQMPHDAAGCHDAEIEIRVGARHGAPDRALVQRRVLRMDDAAKSLSRHGRSELEAADPVELVRPEVFVPLEIRREAARLTEALGLGKMIVGPPERGLGTLSVFDVRADPVPLDDVSLFVAQRVRPEEKPPILAVMAGAAALRLLQPVWNP